MRVMTLASMPKFVPVKSFSHATIDAAFEALYLYVEDITGSAVFAERKSRWLARHATIVDILDPREIGEMALPAGE
jgi:hypothetical protein